MQTRREFIKGMGACIALAAIPNIPLATGTTFKAKEVADGMRVLGQAGIKGSNAGHYLGKGTLYLYNTAHNVMDFRVSIEKIHIVEGKQPVSFSLSEFNEENLRLLMGD